MKRKSLALILVLCLVVSLFAGCGGAKGNNQTTNAAGTSSTAGKTIPKFKIGLPWWTSTDPSIVSIKNNVQAAVEAAGGELVVVNSDMTADSLVNNISELISRNVNGILVMPASDSMLPTIDKMCSKAGVYYATYFRDIHDETIKKQIMASKYFAGGCHEDDKQCAYNITKSLVDMGVKNLCVVNIAKGDTSSDLRDAGVKQAVDETHIKLLNTTYSITTQTDMTKAINSYIAAYPQMDGILLAGTYCDAALPTIEKALADHNLNGKVKVGRIDWDTTMGQFFANKSFNVAYGGQFQIDPMLSMLILVNQVIGTPINSDNTPCWLQTNYLKLTSKEEADNFVKYFQGDLPVYTADEIKKTMIKFYDPSINADTYKKIISSFSVQDVVTRHNGMIK